MKKKASLFSTLTIVFFIAACVFMFVAFFTSTKNVEATSSAAISSEESASSADESAGEAGGAETTPSVVVSELPQETESVEPSSGIQENPKPSFATSAVPESAAKDLSYLDDAVFLGDSITEGMDFHNKSNADIVAYKGLTTVGAVGQPLEKYNNQTAVQAVSDKHPGKIYIMFGSNEIAGINLDTFKTRYGALVDALREKNPNALIFLQTIPPVTEKYSGEGHYLNNPLIKEANQKIVELATEKGVYLLDIHGALADATGALPSEASPQDGVHFGGTTFEKWFNYLLTHTV